MLDLIVQYKICTRFFIWKTNLCSKTLAALNSDLGNRAIFLLEEVSSPLEERRIPLELVRISLEVASSLHSLADSIVLLLLLLPLCNLERYSKNQVNLVQLRHHNPGLPVIVLGVLLQHVHYNVVKFLRGFLLSHSPIEDLPVIRG